MKVVFVGAGRLATNLAPALCQGGVEIVEAWSRTEASASALASRLGCKASWGDVRSVSREADLYLISVADAALCDVVKALHPGREEALMAHTAGSMPLSLFADAGHRRGAVFYPLQTFSKQRQVDFSRVHFFIEAAQTQDVRSLEDLALRLTPPENIHRTSSADRRCLHLAAVFACNFANHCCTLADEVLSQAQLPFEAMLPLIEETVAKLHEMPPAQAQTGPAARGDKNVMGTHLAMLADKPRLQKIYRMLSESIMDK